jgi:phosphodiesterase/alkaline phosphatase D-like protein
MRSGCEAFLDYTPVAVAQNTTARGCTARLRWGKNLELFVLDNAPVPRSELRGDTDAHPKTMLGREQADLAEGAALAAIDARWKVIVSNVPMSIPTGSPRPERA